MRTLTQREIMLTTGGLGASEFILILFVEGLFLNALNDFFHFFCEEHHHEN